MTTETKQANLSVKWMDSVNSVIFNDGVSYKYIYYIEALMQERRSSIANALELGLSCTNPSV